MKDITRYILFGLISILYFISCSKEKVNVFPENNSTPTTINTNSNYQFSVGNYDSATYYLYQPSLDLVYSSNFPGAYADTDSFDLDSDGINDVALHIDGFADGFVSGNTNYFQLTFVNLNNYEIVCDTINNNIDTLNFGDILSPNMNWINNNSYLLRYSSPYNEDGNWGIGYNQKYIGFRTIGNDTIMGWLSLEIPNQQGVALRINDCAIENP